LFFGEELSDYDISIVNGSFYIVGYIKKGSCEIASYWDSKSDVIVQLEVNTNDYRWSKGCGVDITDSENVYACGSLITNTNSIGVGAYWENDEIYKDNNARCICKIKYHGNTSCYVAES